MSDVPVSKRLEIVLGCIEKQVDNPDAWLTACLRNYKNQRLAHTLLGSASVHARERPKSSFRSSDVAQRPPADVAYDTVQAPCIHGQQQQVSREGGNPADEAVIMSTMWPEQKGSMISTLLDVLDEDVTDRFLELEPADQSAISFAYMINVMKDDSTEVKNRMIATWLDRLTHFNGSSAPPVPKSQSSATSGAKVNVQLVLAGMPAIMAGMIVSVLTHALPTLHRDCAVDFMPTIYLNVIDDDSVAIDRVAKAYGETFHDLIHKVEDLASHFETLMQEWKKNNTRFIFVANLGIASTPDGKVQDLEASRLHRKDTEWIWAFRQAAQLTRQYTKNDDVAEIFIGPQAPALHAQLSSIWGEITTSHAAKHPKIPVVMPQVFSTPSKFTVLSVVDNQPLKADPIEAWKTPDLMPWMDKYPGVSISPTMVAKLLVMKLFKERQLRRDEEDMLKAVSTKLESGTQISMPRSRFLTLYGYSDTPADTLLQSVFPCSEFVIPTTGDVASAKSRVKTPCGQQRYCRQCEKVFKVLDQSYPTYVVCDAPHEDSADMEWQSYGRLRNVGEAGGPRTQPQMWCRLSRKSLSSTCNRYA